MKNGIKAYILDQSIYKMTQDQEEGFAYNYALYREFAEFVQSKYPQVFQEFVERLNKGDKLINVLRNKIKNKVQKQ